MSILRKLLSVLPAGCSGWRTQRLVVGATLAAALLMPRAGMAGNLQPFVLAIGGELNLVHGVSIARSEVRSTRNGSVSEESITLRVGARMSKGMRDWLRLSFDRGQVTKNGEIHACDSDYFSQSVVEFRDAYISEVAIPAFDTESRDLGRFTLKLAPTSMSKSKGTGSKLVFKQTRPWLQSNFRLNMGTLPTGRVTRIEPFTWKQSTTGITLPNLELTISLADVAPWQDWVEAFTVERSGKSVDGTLEILAKDLKTVLAVISLNGLTPVSLAVNKLEATKPEFATFQVDLQVGSMRLK